MDPISLLSKSKLRRIQVATRRIERLVELQADNPQIILGMGLGLGIGLGSDSSTVPESHIEQYNNVFANSKEPRVTDGNTISSKKSLISSITMKGKCNLLK